MTLTYSLADVVPYINWVYFDHAWGMTGKPESVCRELHHEAEGRLERYADRYHTYAVFRLFDCYSEGDDVVIREPDSEVGGGGRTVEGGRRLPFLRQQQQGSDYLCMADFISPKDLSLSTSRPAEGRLQSRNPSPSTVKTVLPTRQIGLFATSVDHGFESDFSADPYEKMMMQLLADRLAEATAERLHEQVRKDFWGYAMDEHLSIDEMLQNRFQGIRPAVGYPSLPDVSLNFVLDSLLDMRQVGIRLTESGAMRPHASVSGLMLAHPHARYFSIGKIGDDQLCDYARRRGVPVELMRKFLAANL